jgi:hypothetical protein
LCQIVSYSHTIAIDGINDFNASEFFTTTSSASGYNAHVTWDAANVYVGYEGADVGGTDPNKWVLVYFDADPSAGTGAAAGQLYGSQTPAFPVVFRADYHLRVKADGSYADLMSYSGTAWGSIAAPGMTHAQSSGYMEIKIPRAIIGNPNAIGIVALMDNEAAGSEWSYAGLFAGSFTDAWYANLPIGKFLVADLNSLVAPNSAANQKTAKLVINEVSTRGAAGSDEMVELYNGTAATINLSGYKLYYRAAATSTGYGSTLATLGALSIPSGKHLLLGAGSGNYTGTVAADATFTAGIADAGSVWLFKAAAAGGGLLMSDTNFVDLVGFGTTAIAANYEGATPATSPATAYYSIERRLGVDTDNNGADFAVNPVRTPENLASP